MTRSNPGNTNSGIPIYELGVLSAGKWYYCKVNVRLLAGYIRASTNRISIVRVVNYGYTKNNSKRAAP